MSIPNTFYQTITRPTRLEQEYGPSKRCVLNHWQRSADLSLQSVGVHGGRMGRQQVVRGEQWRNSHMEQTQQHVPPAPKNKHNFKHGFLRSTWITACWNWFLMFAGKAAEPVLTISVIYSCARLLPGINLPVQCDNTVFICQMIALDIGGLGLRKLANQARKDGNGEGAKLAGIVSTALLTIMGINVALSVLESVSQLDPTIVKVIEGILLIVRAIMAVLYAFVIHSLHGEDDNSEPYEAPPPQPDLQQAIEQALAEQVTLFDQRIQAIATEQTQMLAAIQRMQASPAPTPAVDTQAIIAGVISQFDECFTTAMKRFQSDAEQRVRISQASEIRQDRTNRVVSSGTSGTLASAPKLASLPQQKESGDALKRSMIEHLAAPSTSSTQHAAQSRASESIDYKSVLYSLLDQDNSRQIADLVQFTGFPKTTVWRWWNRYHEEHGTRGQGRIVAGSIELTTKRDTK